MQNVPARLQDLILILGDIMSAANCIGWATLYFEDGTTYSRHANGEIIMNNEVVCPACSGGGLIPICDEDSSYWERCETCLGRGEIEYPTKEV